MKLTTKQSREIMNGHVRYIKRANKLYRVEFMNGKFIGRNVGAEETKEFKSQYYDLMKRCDLL